MSKINTLDEVKPKSIIVGGELHYRLKALCRTKSLKIGGVVEDLIKLYLFNPKLTQKLIEENNDKNLMV